MGNLNYHCKWRLELAKKICEKIRGVEGTKGIRAIIVGGSVARGYADEYSDIEIPIFWEELPNEKLRKLIVKELNAEFFYPYNHEAREDNIIVNELRIDLWHITLEQEEQVIKSVIEDFEIDFGSSNAIDTIRTCIPIFGEEIISSWKTKAKEYPKQIAISSINKALQSIDSTQVELLIQRENSTLLFEHIANLQKNIFIILLALNKEYFPTFKWMYKSLEGFKIKPDNVEQRFRDVFNYSIKEAYENTLAILFETIDMINNIYPEVNTNIVLSKLKSARIPHLQPIDI
ncbi:nucleotidyltransferase domain-containing protein [Clostridium tunisiense]|uniref:nucleotidyltransferase domain-containing protein n=1 Tax=Clostridium tunisiense TaxID=219748 RepID=UPI0002DE7DB2|nr:nucleotidyltransferase domain-containing protein [Clostridium tunisiense]